MFQVQSKIQHGHGVDAGYEKDLGDVLDEKVMKKMVKWIQVPIKKKISTIYLEILNEILSLRK